MKLSTLLELIGSGSILLIVGAGAILLGVGFGLSEATQVPLWVSFCGLGLFAVAAGFMLIDRGSDEAEEQVTKAMTPMIAFARSPWAGFAAAVIGGLVLQRLLRAKREVVVNRPTVIPVEVVPTSTAQDANRATTPKVGGIEFLEIACTRKRAPGNSGGRSRGRHGNADAGGSVARRARAFVGRQQAGEARHASTRAGPTWPFRMGGADR